MPDSPIIIAVPKGRILSEALPLLAAAGIRPEAAFGDENSRALRFATDNPGIALIRVRAFDVATFVAHGAAQLGIVGSDVLAEFGYSELYAPVDLGIGHCRISVAEPADMAATDDPRGWSHVRVATKYPGITARHFAARGVQAECVKLNGAMELAPTLGLAPRIVDLVSSGRTLKENGLVEVEVIAEVTSRLVVNRAAMKTRARVVPLVEAFRRAVAEQTSPLPLASSRSTAPRAVEDVPGAHPTSNWVGGGPVGSSGDPLAAPSHPPNPSRKREGDLIRLDTRDPGFPAQFDTLVNARRETDTGVARDVAAIILSVRDQGEAAVRAFTQKLDRHDLDASGWRIEPATCAQAFEALEPELRAALELAANRIRAYHEKQLPQDSDFTDSAGVRLGARWRAVDAAGLYVPGGRAAYPSSLLMNAIPAKVAGVERIAMATPTPNGEINPLVLAAAHLAGVDEIWRVGGAQAIAAFAYGAGRIAPVDVVTGPGNAWVAEAKRQLFGVVGIDMVAGPSEIVVVADAKNPADWIAADLLSQAEHDVTTQSILFTDDSDFADAVAVAVDRQIPELTTAATARAAWDANGAIVVVDRLEDALPLVDRLAPEHLQLAVDDPQALFDRIRHAGSVFLGRHTPEAIGDYVAGPNHVLPTGRRARFASGLSVLDFMKRTSFLGLDQTALAELGPATVALANAEGLPAHAKSVALRLRLNR